MSPSFIKRSSVVLLTCMLLSCFVVVAGEVHAEGRTPPLLRYDSRGPWVRALQVKLAQWNSYPGPVTGYFDLKTLEAVKEFQSRNSIRQSGVVDETTWAALGYASTYSTRQYTPSRAGSWEDDVQLLARVVAAEAGDEPFEGQVAVAAVILNRTKSPLFPPTIPNVIFQPWAFESVATGYIWAVAVTAENVRAAVAALNGWDPSFGSLYFWNPYKAVISWIWTRSIIRQIGHHVFAR